VDASIALCTVLAHQKKAAAAFGRHSAIAAGVVQRYAVPFLECGVSVIFVLDGTGHPFKVASTVRREERSRAERDWRELQALLDRPQGDISAEEAAGIRSEVRRFPMFEVLLDSLGPMQYGLPEQPACQLTSEERMLLSRWMTKRAGDATSIEPGMITELRAAAERVTEELAAYAARGNLPALTVTVLQAAREVLLR
jgi:hypothetical protein